MPNERILVVDDQKNIRFTVVNAYTQYDWKGKGTLLVDYGAIRSVFQQIKQEFSGLKIGYPLIGAGLAGGDWQIISAMIDEALEGEDHTLVEFVPPPNPRRLQPKRPNTIHQKKTAAEKVEKR